MEYGCVEVDHPFWSNSEVLSLLTKHCSETHEPFHRRTCFKKGCECRFIFPYRIYLFEELDLEKSYAATEQLKLFLKRMMEKEEALIINRESNMAANVDESSDYSIIQLKKLAKTMCRLATSL
jgi:hypothetical protein